MTIPPVLLELLHKLTALAVVVILTLSLLSFAGTYLYLELATHFRLQYLLVAVLCLGVLLASQSWKLVPLALCCVVLNLLPILPYYLNQPKARASTQVTGFKLLLANAFEKNRNYAELLAEVKRTNPDVFVLQEFTDEWQANTTSLNEAYPFTLLEARPSGMGMAIFSRLPLLTAERLTLDASDHVALRVEISVQQQRVMILALHPTTPVTPWKFKNRNKQFAEAAAIIRATSGPRVLVGDLNTTMWSPYFAKLLSDSGLRDARRGFGLHTSWPTALPGFMRLPIDHCLVSEEWLVQGVSTGDVGSDHKTVLFDLALS